MAFSDESSHSHGRFRAISVVTLAAANHPPFRAHLATLLADSDVNEFKWEKLKNAKYRFAAEKLLDASLSWAAAHQLRVDTIIWDTHDQRHNIQNRDDIANLGRMHYHLLCWIFSTSWPRGAIWRFCPDEMEAMDWRRLEQFVHYDGLTRALPPEGLRTIRGEGYRIAAIEPMDSASEPLIQVADLFAGMAVYSRERFDRFEAWEEGERTGTGGGLGTPLSGGDRHRGPILRRLDEFVKARAWHVGLRSSRGLRTYNPRIGRLNFWLYVPQHEEDRAPARWTWG